MKVIRKPLTTIDGKDFITGKEVKSEPIEQEIGLQAKINKRKEKKLKNIREDGKVFIDGFGWVTL